MQLLASGKDIRPHHADVEEQALHTRLQEYHDTIEQLQLWECTPDDQIFIKVLTNNGRGKATTAVCSRRYQVGLLPC